MMSAAWLRHLAFERFVALTLTRDKNDKRTPDELRQIAAREVVQEARREARINGKSQTGPLSQNTPANAFETLFNRIWKIVSNQRTYAELMRRKSQAVPKPKITIDSNPVIVDERINGRNVTSNIVAFPKHAPLLSTSLRTAELLPEHEFPKLGGMADETINNFHNSILQNESIARERERRSIQHRNSQQQKYVG
jgi:hypothetical protein